VLGIRSVVLAFPLDVSRTVAALALAVAFLGASGCKGCSDGGPSPAASAKAPSHRAASASSGRAIEHPGQPLIRAIESLDARPDQKEKLAAIAASLEAQGKVVKATRGALAEALAAGVRANKIDRPALAPAIEGVKNAGKATQLGMQNAFDDLHKTLDIAQRKKLLTGMRRELDQRSNGGRGEGRFRVDEVGTELGLNPDQLAKIRAAIKEHAATLPPVESKDHRPVGQQLKDFVKAFESDEFDGKSFTIGGDPSQLAERGAELLIASTEATLPELNAEQRDKLADKLVERARPASPE
jgi:Spy/CpxP family protein refolding chaperone